MVLSEHARARMQQRGIPARVVDWLAAYGAVEHQPGAEIFYFDRTSRLALERDIGRRQVRRFAKALSAYMVYEKGRITTVGHRFRRIKRH